MARRGEPVIPFPVIEKLAGWMHKRNVSYFRYDKIEIKMHDKVSTDVRGFEAGGYDFDDTEDRIGFRKPRR